MPFRLQDHISSLYSYFPGKVLEFEPMMIYQISMQSSRAQINYSLTATLPPDFPAVCPVFSVEPALAHSWINSSMDVVGHPALKTWTGTVLIGKIIKDIELEFSLRPPTYSSVPRFKETPQKVTPKSSEENLSVNSESNAFPELDIKT